MIVSLLAFLLIDNNQSDAGGEDGKLGGDFRLTGINGEVSLRDFEGSVVVLYFGFLNCPKVCPTSMGMVTKSLNLLSEQELKQVQAILISVDPERDTYQALANYTRQFHPNILGITGTHQQIDAVKNNYAAYAEIIESQSADSAYAFRHTSRYFVINQQGKLVDAMRHSTTANELVARIRTLI